MPEMVGHTLPLLKAPSPEPSWLSLLYEQPYQSNHISRRSVTSYTAAIFASPQESRYRMATQTCPEKPSALAMQTCTCCSM